MVNFINFLGTNNFLSHPLCPTLNPFEQLPIEMLLCNYENLLVLGASLFEYVRTAWMSFKYHIKSCSKNKHKQSKTHEQKHPQQSQVYEISATVSVK